VLRIETSETLNEEYFESLTFLERRVNFVKEKFHLNPAAHTANAVSKRSRLCFLHK
jgi:hypothetical protein